MACPRAVRRTKNAQVRQLQRKLSNVRSARAGKATAMENCLNLKQDGSIEINFYLSNSEMIYGRAVMEVRICASPGRDSTEKEISNNQKNSKNTDKRNEPISTTDVPTPMPLPTTNSPGSSPTYPPRASVLMSASKDPSSAPEPFQFPPVQTQLSRKRRKFLVFLQCLQT